MSSTISVKGVLIEDGEVVLLENERGEWELPGGRPEPGEDPAACLAREFAEELGAEIAVGAIVDCWNYEVLPGQHVAIVTYQVARKASGEPKVSAEHRRFGWFAVETLDALPLPDGYRRSIRAVASLEPGWLVFARELQAIAQTGSHYAQDAFDQLRYARLRELGCELMALGSGAAGNEIAQLFRQDIGYSTPRVGVRGAVFRDDQILLVREATDGCWSLPGGWADVNQSAAQCVEREIWEESGYTARAVKLAAVWDKSRHGHPPSPVSVCRLFFICELTGGAPRTSSETTEIGFFAEDALPELSIRPSPAAPDPAHVCALPSARPADRVRMI